MNNQAQVYLNKNSLDLSEDNLDAHYGDGSLHVMKNDFFNEDFYDYKDTFMANLEGPGRAAKKGLASNSTKLVKIETGEDYEDDLGNEEDDQDIDYNNDFTTGPLAIKKNSILLADKESGEESGYDNTNFDNEVHFKHNGNYALVFVEGVWISPESCVIKMGKWMNNR
jgi:hypothetical protein